MTGFFKGQGFLQDAGQVSHFFHHGGRLVGIFRPQLGPVSPIGLKTIVLLGVVAGRQHDAADTVIVADGKGEHGDRPQFIGEADSQAIAYKNGCRQPGKFT